MRKIKFVQRTHGISKIPYVDTVMKHCVFDGDDDFGDFIRVKPHLFYDRISLYEYTNYQTHQKIFGAGALTNAAIMYHYGDVISFVDDDFGDVTYLDTMMLDLAKPEIIKHWSNDLVKPDGHEMPYDEFVRMAYDLMGSDNVVQLGTYGKPAEVIDRTTLFTGNPTAKHCISGVTAKMVSKSFWFTPSILDTTMIEFPTIAFARHEDTCLGAMNQIRSITLPAFIHHKGERHNIDNDSALDYLVYNYIMSVMQGMPNREICPPKNDMQLWLEMNFRMLCEDCKNLKSQEDKKKFVESIFYHGEMP